LNFKLVANRV